MSKSNKFYWLKLQDDFFNQREIKKLRKIPGGDTYTIIVLKLYLYSIKNEGVVFYESTEKDIFEQIALELDEDYEAVKMTIIYLQSHKLFEEIEQNEFILPYAVENIGSESESKQRVAKHRERKKLIGVTCNADVTQKNVTTVTCNTEKERELEKERENTKEKINKKEKPIFGFEEFWDCYPAEGKKSKQKALAAFKKINPDASILATMLNALEAQKAERDAMTINGVSFIPSWKHATTWLNGHCWEDEVKTSTQIEMENKALAVRQVAAPRKLTEFEKFKLKQQQRLAEQLTDGRVIDGSLENA